MYRKALTKQGSNKRGVKPQHIDMGDKKALETPKELGEKDTRKRKRRCRQNTERTCYIAIYKS
jgi:hypothetical protein